MSISLLVAAVGCLGVVVVTGLLVARCLRAPTGVLVAWTVAMFGLAVSLLAQASGHAIGFGPVAFRAMEIGAGVIAPLAIAAGLAEVAGKSLPARFAARLILPAIGFVALVVLGSDPLTAAPFSKSWPDPAVFYQIFPNNLLGYIAPVVVIVVLIAVGCVLARPRRNSAWQQAVPPVAAAALAALVISVPGLIALAALQHHPVKLPLAGLFAPLCIIAAALTWFACQWASELNLNLMRYGEELAQDEWGQRPTWSGRPEETGDFAPLGGDEDPYGGLYRQDDDSYAGYPGQDYDRGGYAANGAYQDGGPDTGFGDDSGFGPDTGFSDDTGFGRAVPAGPGGYQGQDGDGRGGADLFGQIAIYTLLDDRVTEFDRLTRHVVKQVRVNEPDTLVFIVHAVPSAPMQRILYEVYRDREAYEEHKRQPYLVQFESDRRPYVLATNVIELGLQQAKVSPLPSISALLTDTGFDLLNDSGYGQPGFGPRDINGTGGRPADHDILGGAGGVGGPGIRGPGPGGPGGDRGPRSAGTQGGHRPV
jgi:quinol monooxygenase YgiN